MQKELVVQKQFQDIDVAYAERDTILYALGVGFGSSPLDRDHLRYVYESELVAVPTMANVLGHPGFWARDPQYKIEWNRILHAEQRLQMHRSVPAAGRLIAKNKIVGIRDRGILSGAMLHQQKQLFEPSTGELVASVTQSMLLRGDGGCGDWGEAPGELPRIPEVAADENIEVDTLDMQALIYRLSGDYNPLHVDPAVAAAAGFERPILHGLATMGFAGYAFLRKICALDASRLKSFNVRFTSPVLAGDRIKVEFWRERENPNVIRFRAVVAARNKVVLDRGQAEVE